MTEAPALSAEITDLLERLKTALGEAGIDIPARPAPIYWQQAPKD